MDGRGICTVWRNALRNEQYLSGTLHAFFCCRTWRCEVRAWFPAHLWVIYRRILCQKLTEQVLRVLLDLVDSDSLHQKHRWQRSECRSPRHSNSFTHMLSIALITFSRHASNRAGAIPKHPKQLFIQSQSPSITPPPNQLRYLYSCSGESYGSIKGWVNEILPSILTR